MKRSLFTFHFSLFTFHSSLFTLHFFVAVLLFFGLAYPHHLHYQEQYQLFLFDSNYVWEIVRLPGGVADLLGRFCTQFFLFAWVGALIIAILLSAVRLLTRLPMILSLVPAFLLWLFLLDENALLGGVWAVLLTLLAAWAFDKIPSGWMRYILLLIAVPAVYWMVGPVCVVFFLLQAQREGKAIAFLAVLALMPIILACFLPVHTGSLWYGIHYHRYPTEIPVLLWAAALSVFVLSLTVRIFRTGRRVCDITRPVSRLLTPVSCLLCLLCGLCAVWKTSNFKAEKVMGYDFMARHQQWNRILETINAEKPNNQIGVTVQNLALGMHGLLIDHLFDYNQNGLLGLLPDVGTDAVSPLPTAEAFYQLGMINIAHRTVFEAQEAILDFQKSGRCYKRLAQTNLINGSYEVARKYLSALQKTLFYKEWADETLPLLGDEEAIAKHPEYGRLRRMTYDKDFYFGDHVTPEMLEDLCLKNEDNRLAYQYLVAYYMLTGDRDGYTNFLRKTSTKQ